MVTVVLYGPLRAAAGGNRSVDLPVEPTTVHDVVAAFVDAYPSLESQLYAADGALRPSVRVMLDGTRAAMDDPCPADAEIALFPAMQGG